jgi:nucleotide-binding universal stress UspA family protein
MQPFQLKLIVVPTDFSEPAAHALRYASALSERFGSHLLVIYADSSTPPIDLGGRALNVFAQYANQMIEETRERLEIHAEQNINPLVPYDVRVVVDSPVNAIIEHACDAGADLIVMGTHGRTGLSRLLVGSVTEGVIRSATMPVIAVNSTTAETAGVHTVLCPVTFTADSRVALRYAADLTDTPNSPLVLFHGLVEQELQSTVDELLRLQDWAPKELVDRCVLKIMPERVPPEQIVQFAKLTSADLIALGVPVDRSIADVFRGTIAEQILHASSCPVLMVNERVGRQTRPTRELELTAM